VCLLLSSLVLSAMVGTASPAAAEQAASPEREKPAAQPGGTTISVEHDEKTFATKVTIRAPGGRVAWSDVLRALARARGFDDSALDDVLPEGSLNLGGAGWRLFCTGINLALGPGMRFGVQRPVAPGGELQLVITMDGKTLLESQRRFQNRLRNGLLRRRPGARFNYGLVLDEGWQRAAADKDLVVTVHGLNSGPYSLERLLAGPREEGFPCAVFRYPNDQAIADSARLLSNELKRLGRAYPGRGVTLITHSMGGLVGRAVIEDIELDPGNVRRLIMISPPNGGSMLAHFAYGLDLAEHVGDASRRKEAGLMYEMVEDGLSEAYADLNPESPFLAKLNTRPRNPKTRYSIFLGTSAPLAEADLARLRTSLTDPKNRWTQFFGARIGPWLADMDEVVDGKGDGAVAVERGRLKGVSDVVLLKFNHVSVLRAPSEGDDVQKLHQMVLARLKGEK
jgi:pimeloyl-ACP methyl ester carboxylesterase